MTDENTKSIWPKVGYVVSALPALGLLASGGMKVSQGAEIVKSFTEFGYQPSSLVPIGIVEMLIALMYAVPQTSYLGAILATGYLGGAVATHVRVGQPFVAPLLLGILVWAGLFARDARLRVLLPLSRRP